MENELKPCPFCGCNLIMRKNRFGVWFDHPGDECILTHIADDCGCFTLSELEIEEWNRRCNNGT